MKIKSEHFNQTNFTEKLQNEWNEIYYNTYLKTLEFAEKIEEKGGRTYFVWGSTRDIIMGIIPKDFDIEVHGITSEIIEDIAEKLWKISKVWKSFWILKLFIEDGIDIDISIPRHDSKTWSGHRGFDIQIDPNMWIIEATKRRDFTINSISLDVMTWEFFDPYGWLEDIENKILKITDSDTFSDDPLRILRGIQFIGRFDLLLDLDSAEIIKSMLPSLQELAKERIWEEYKKLLFKSTQPSRGLGVAYELWIFNFIQTELMLDKSLIEQTYNYIDNAAKYIQNNILSLENKSVLMLWILCINIPKNSRKHFLLSIDTPRSIITKISKLLDYIHIPKEYYGTEQSWNKIWDGMIRKLSLDLCPATIEQIVMISQVFDKDKIYWDWILSRATKIDVATKKPDDILSGKELIELWFIPWDWMGKIINYANRLRDDEELLKWEIIDRVKVK